MELLQELFITVSLSLLLAFLFAKIITVANSTSSTSSPDHGRKVFTIDEHVVPAAAAADAEEERGKLILGGEGRGPPGPGGFDFVEVAKGGEAEGGVVEEEAMGVESVDECVANEVKDDGTRRIDVVLVDAEELGKSGVVEIDVARSASVEGSAEEGVPGSLELGEFVAGWVDGEGRLGNERAEELTAAQQSEECETAKDVGVENEEVGREGIGAGTTRQLYIEDDWEGIERSELENLFACAMLFVNSAAGADALAKLGGEEQMQLYGLRKIATEGPCYETQPLALMVSARARWHAWQKLGNMNQEVAMEQYIALLSDKIHGWMKDKSCVENKCEAGVTSSEVGGCSPKSLYEREKLFTETKRKPDLK